MTTTLRDKIAARLRVEKWNITGRSDGHDTIDTVASMFERGDFDDLLGVPEPSLADVQREARRVYGEGVVVRKGNACVRVETPEFYNGRPNGTQLQEMNTTLAAAYFALRALPTKGET